MARTSLSINVDLEADPEFRKSAAADKAIKTILSFEE
jgi:hypothetical protein